MTEGWLTVRQTLGVATAGLVAALLGLCQPGLAAQMENPGFLDGLRDLKVPDAPAPSAHPSPTTPSPGRGGHRGGPRTQTGATKGGGAEVTHATRPSAAVPDGKPANPGVPPALHAVSAAPTPGAGGGAPGNEAEAQRLKAELATATSALVASRAHETAAGDLQATVEALTRKADGLQEALTHAEKERDEARTDAEGQLARSVQDTADARKSRDEAQGALSASLKDVAGLKADLAAREASLTAVENQVAELSGVKQDLTKQTQTVADLNASVADLTRERDALKAEAVKNAQTAKRDVPSADEAPPATVARPAPETAAEKEAYVSGWEIAGMVRRARVVQTALGLAADQDSFMAGLQDGVTGKPALPGEQMADLASRFGTELDSRERARFAAGMDRLEKMTGSPALVKRNGSVLFLRKKAGKVAAKAGMVIRGSLKETIVDGRVVTDRQNITFDYGPALPAIVRDAITLGQVGSVMEVVCFGADIYPLEAMPAEVYPWSLMRYTITTTDVVSRGAGDSPGPLRAGH